MLSTSIKSAQKAVFPYDDEPPGYAAHDLTNAARSSRGLVGSVQSAELCSTQSLGTDAQGGIASIRDELRQRS